jgi:transposase
MAMTRNSTRTLSIVRPASAPLLCEPGEVIHVGVDVHKATYHVAILSDRRGLIATWVQPARPELLAERLTPLREGIARVVYEAGPTGFALVRRLLADGFHAEVIAPAKTPVTPGAEPKTDRLDCRKLAVFAQKCLLTPIRVPTEQEEADRQVLRLREQLVRKSRSVQQQIKAFLLQHGVAEPKGLSCWSEASLKALRGLDLAADLRFCLDVMLDELGHARGQVARVTKRLRELAQSERHRPAVADLSSVPGVGPITAMTFRLELPEPERFEHQGQVARMMGLAPQVVQSGQTRRSGRLLKSGNARLRTVLVESAWRWVARDESAARRYRQLVGNTGSGKKAIVAMARRLGVLLWRLSVRHEPYRAAA